jgi:hypothetical protein
MDLAHHVRDAIGRLYKVLPTAVVAHAMKRSMTRRELEADVDALIDTLRARGANLGVLSGRQAVEEGLEPLADATSSTSNQGGRVRVRERTVLKYYARTLQHLLTFSAQAGDTPLMIDAVSKAFFHGLARSQALLKSVASRYGMRRSGGFARRFIAGETLDEAIEAAARSKRAASRRPSTCSARASPRWRRRRGHARLPRDDRPDRRGRDRPQHLAQAHAARPDDRPRHLRGQPPAHPRRRRAARLLRPHRHGGLPVTQVTLDVFETMWQQGYRNVGAVLQSYLPRSVQDARRLNELGARVRLVKGAYNEPKGVAYQKKDQVDAAFVEILELLLSQGTYPAIATHDPAMLDATKAFAARRGIAQDRYEFQMLYGIRRDLQAQLRRRATTSASTFRSAANGSRTSCAAWASAPPILDS